MLFVCMFFFRHSILQMLFVFMLCLGLLTHSLFILSIIMHSAFNLFVFPNSMFTPVFICERAMCSLVK